MDVRTSPSLDPSADARAGTLEIDLDGRSAGSNVRWQFGLPCGVAILPTRSAASAPADTGALALLPDRTDAMRIANYPNEFAHRAATILGSKLETSITVRQHGLTVRGGSSTDAAARCDQAEARAGDGPCIDAMIDTTARLVPQIANEDRWQAWREQAVREGFVSAIAVPALATVEVAIALNLYSRTSDPWTPELLTAADGYAQLVAAMVRLQLQTAELEDAAAGFYRHLSDAIVAERAIGAIMHTNACDEDEARRILDSATYHRNVGRREVAETILRALVVPEQPPERDHFGD